MFHLNPLEMPTARKEYALKYLKHKMKSEVSWYLSTHQKEEEFLQLILPHLPNTTHNTTQNTDCLTEQMIQATQFFCGITIDIFWTFLRFLLNKQQQGRAVL